MEFETNRNTEHSDAALGADNADILAAKRRRDAALAAGRTNADTLRAQLRSASSDASGRQKSVIVQKPAPARNATAGAAPVQKPAPARNTASGAAPVQKPAPARNAAFGAAPVQKPATVRNAASVSAPVQKPAPARNATAGAAPVQKSAPARNTASGAASVQKSAPVRNAASGAASVQKPAPARNTASVAAPVQKPAPARNTAAPSPAPRRGIPPAIPFQQADAGTSGRMRKEQGSAPTRITDISGIRAAVPAGAAETRLTDVHDIRRNKLPEPPEDEVKDESEGSNTIISIIKAVTYIVAVVVVSVFLSFFVILVGNDIYAFVKDDTVTEVTVPEYATLNDVSELLFENHIIKYPTVFKLYANFKKDDGQFLAGEYALSPMMNYDELLAAFKPKKPSGISRITIPEGYTTDEIIDLFVSKGIGTREGYIDVINHYDFDYWFVDELEQNGIPDGRYYRLDGYLFPDTYEFYNASSEKTVIDKLLRRFDEIFSSAYRQKAEELGYTVDQILIIASMIEKEAGTQSDFFDVSSVFNNRLKNPAVYPYMESDATVVYAIQHDTGERVTPSAQDMTYDSVYNTYTHKGLPPGPIANPSASAIRAALYPSDTEYYYFVSSSSRVTYFAATLEEHNKNIEKIKSGEMTAPPEEKPAN
ncbi:MAG: endolytic transglycosylase MltG [Eubacteriales bacterium]